MRNIIFQLNITNNNINDLKNKLYDTIELRYFSNKIKGVYSKVTDNKGGWLVSNNTKGNFENLNIVPYDDLFDALIDNISVNTNIQITIIDSQYLRLSVTDLNVTDDYINTNVKYIYPLTKVGYEFVTNNNSNLADVQNNKTYFATLNFSIIKVFCNNCGAEITLENDNHETYYCNECKHTDTECIKPKYNIGDIIYFNHKSYLVLKVKLIQLDDNDIPIFGIKYYTNEKNVILTELNGEIINID